MCSGLPVPGIAQVTAGCDTIHLRKYCAQLAMPSSAAQARQGLAAHAAEHRALGERAVGDHRDAQFLRQRQQALFRLALGERVVDLHEIVLPGPEQALDLKVGVRGVMRDADVAHALLRLPFAQRGRVDLHVDEVVHLHQVHAPGTHALDGALHLADAFVAALRVHLGRHEQRLADAERGAGVAHHRLARAVHRRGIHDAAAAGEEKAQHLLQRGARRRVATHVERLPGADADHRQLLAARRDCARVHRLLAHRRPHQGEAGEAAKRAQRCASVLVHAPILVKSVLE